jgi:hypothetical protein
MGRAYFEMSHKQLRDRLALPGTTQIIGIAQSVEDAMRGRIRIYVESPYFEEKTYEQDVMRCVYPMYHTRTVELGPEFDRWE